MGVAGKAVGKVAAVAGPASEQGDVRGQFADGKGSCGAQDEGGCLGVGKVRGPLVVVGLDGLDELGQVQGAALEFRY